MSMYRLEYVGRVPLTTGVKGCRRSDQQAVNYRGQACTKPISHTSAATHIIVLTRSTSIEGEPTAIADFSLPQIDGKAGNLLLVSLGFEPHLHSRRGGSHGPGRNHRMPIVTADRLFENVSLNLVSQWLAPNDASALGPWIGRRGTRLAFSEAGLDDTRTQAASGSRPHVSCGPQRHRTLRPQEAHKAPLYVEQTRVL